MDALLRFWLTEWVLGLLLVAGAAAALWPKRGWRTRHYASFLFASGSGLLAWFTISLWTAESLAPLALIPFFPMAFVALVAGSLVAGTFVERFYDSRGLLSGRESSHVLVALGAITAFAVFVAYIWLVPKAWQFGVEREWETVPKMIEPNRLLKYDLTAGSGARGVSAYYEVSASAKAVLEHYSQSAPREGWIRTQSASGQLAFCKRNGYWLRVGPPGRASIPSGEGFAEITDRNDVASLRLFEDKALDCR